MNETPTSFVVDPTGRLFVGTYSGSGVFVSSDDGLTWSKSNAGLNYDEVLSLTISSGGVIFAGTFYRGVFKSTDAGSQWTQLQLPIAGSPAVFPVLSMCADSGNNVYAGVAGQGLFRSSDGGQSWSLVGFQGGQPGDVGSLICPSPGKILAVTGYGVYRSTDKGTTWVQLGVNLPYVNSISLNSSGQIFAFTDNGVFRSVDGGLNWTGFNLGLAKTQVISGAVGSKDYVFAGSDGEGIARSTDNGVAWKEINSGLTGNSIWSLVSTTAGVLFAGTDRGLFASKDKGETWINTHTLPSPVYSLLVNSHKTLFAATGAGVYRSTDDGANWLRVDKGFQWTYIYSLCADSIDGVYAATTLTLIYRSTDSGDTWSLAANLGHSVYALACSPLGEVYAGTFLGGMYRSSDRGVTWSVANGGIPSHDHDTTIFTISVLRDGDVLAGNSLGQLSRSTDHGSSWKTVIDTAGPVRAIVQDGNGIVYAGFGNRVLCSSNQGTTWHVSGDNFGRGAVRALEFDRDGYLFAGLALGTAYRSSTSIPTRVPSQYLVSQNYPNPFNSSTIIPFSIAGLQRVELKVYSLLGQEVATLVTGQLARGTYEVRWNASTVASGVYFYRIQAGEYVETKKMILLK